MNKKGFTLIEILAVLVLIGIVGGLGYTVITSITQNVKNEMLEKKANIIEEAAIMYGENLKGTIINSSKKYNNNKCTSIKVKDLIPEYLDSDMDEDNYVNALTRNTDECDTTDSNYLKDGNICKLSKPISCGYNSSTYRSGNVIECYDKNNVGNKSCGYIGNKYHCTCSDSSKYLLVNNTCYKKTDKCAGYRNTAYSYSSAHKKCLKYNSTVPLKTEQYCSDGSNPENGFCKEIQNHIIDPSDSNNFLDDYEVIIYYKNKRIYAKMDLDNNLECE